MSSFKKQKTEKFETTLSWKLSASPITQASISQNVKKSKSFFFKKKLSVPGLFVVYFQSFSNKRYNFYNKLIWKIFHPRYGAGIWAHNLQNMSLIP